MLMYDMMIFGWNQSDIDNQLRKLIGPRQPGFWEWIEDTRVKFKKFQCRDLPAADSKALQQRLDEAIQSLGAEDVEATLLTLGNIKSKFSKQLIKANVQVARHETSMRNLKTLREAKQRNLRTLNEAKQVDGNSWIVKILEGVIFFFNFVFLPITVPIGLVRGGATAVQNHIRPPNASAAERAELRNQLMHQVFTLAKTRKKDAEELRKVEHFMADAKKRYLAVQAPPDWVEDKKKKKKSRFGWGLVGMVTGRSVDGGKCYAIPTGTSVDGTSLDGRCRASGFRATGTSLYAGPLGHPFTESGRDALQEMPPDASHEIPPDASHDIPPPNAGGAVGAVSGGAAMYHAGVGIKTLPAYHLPTTPDRKTRAAFASPVQMFASRVEVVDESRRTGAYAQDSRIGAYVQDSISTLQVSTLQDSTTHSQDPTTNFKTGVLDALWQMDVESREVESREVESREVEWMNSKLHMLHLPPSHMLSLPGTAADLELPTTASGLNWGPAPLDNLMGMDYACDLMGIDYDACDLMGIDSISGAPGGGDMRQFRDKLIPIPGEISPSGLRSPNNTTGAHNNGVNKQSVGAGTRKGHSPLSSTRQALQQVA